MFDAIGARITTYDALIVSAQRAYGEYLEARKELSELERILSRL